MTAVAELAARWEGIELPAAAAMAAHAVLDRLGSSESGLVPEGASVRLAAVRPNALLSHGPSSGALTATQEPAPHSVGRGGDRLGLIR